MLLSLVAASPRSRPRAYGALTARSAAVGEWRSLELQMVAACRCVAILSILSMGVELTAGLA
jgi:hypothetical protein